MTLPEHIYKAIMKFMPLSGTFKHAFANSKEIENNANLILNYFRDNPHTVNEQFDLYTVPGHELASTRGTIAHALVEFKQKDKTGFPIDYFSEEFNEYFLSNLSRITGFDIDALKNTHSPKYLLSNTALTVALLTNPPLVKTLLKYGAKIDALSQVPTLSLSHTCCADYILKNPNTEFTKSIYALLTSSNFRGDSSEARRRSLRAFQREYERVSQNNYPTNNTKSADRPHTSLLRDMQSKKLVSPTGTLSIRKDEVQREEISTRKDEVQREEIIQTSEIQTSEMTTQNLQNTPTIEDVPTVVLLDSGNINDLNTRQDLENVEDLEPADMFFDAENPEMMNEVKNNEEMELSN